MLKIFFIVASAIIIVFVSFAMMCSMIIAGRSDKQSNMENTKASDDTSSKKLICPKCKTGKDSFEPDKNSEICPYIECLENGRCQFYVPLEKPSKTGILKRNKDKVK